MTCYFSFCQNGQLDVNFGTNGLVFTNITNASGPMSVETVSASILTNSQKIFLAGRANSVAYIVKYNYDGSLDTTFQNDGIQEYIINGEFEFINDMIQQNDGKILFVGRTRNNNHDDIFIGRITEDGDLDTSFGTNGIKTINISFQSSESGNAIALQDDGKIIIAGSTTSGTGSITDMLIIRLHENGDFDNAFGNNGIKTVTIINHRQSFSDIDITPNGKIIGTGTVVLTVGSSQGRIGLVRFLQNGDLDTSFNNTGYFYLNVSSEGASIPYKIVGLENNKILVGGTSYSTLLNKRALTILKFNEDGQYDTTFGNSGIVQTDIANSSSSDIDYRDLKLIDNGILALGNVNFGNYRDFILNKYDSNGTIDLQFGNNGNIITDFSLGDSGVSDSPNSLLINNNHLIATGWSQNVDANDYSFIMARYTFEDNFLNTNDYILNNNKLFPNPCKNYFKIESKEQIDKVEIYDINGRLLQTDFGVQATYDVSYFSKGMYFVKIFSSGKHQLIKITKH